MTNYAEQNTGSPICTEHWHDGPLREFRVVRFIDKTGAEEHRMLQVDGLGWVSTGHGKHDMHHMRFTRKELVDMLSIIDDQPVEDFHGDMRLSAKTKQE